MRVRVHVGVDAQGHSRDFSEFRGYGVDPFQFRKRFQAEIEDLVFDRQFDLLGALSDARVDAFLRIAARVDDALKLAAGNDVEAGAGLGEKFQDVDIAAGFHREADLARIPFQGLREIVVALFYVRSAVKVERRPEFAGRVFYAHSLAVELFIFPLEIFLLHVVLKLKRAFQIWFLQFQ